MDVKEGLPVYTEIDGHQIEIKYPGKLYWPDDHITKLELVNYYIDIAGTMMPYLEKRPVTLRYFPRGIHKISFYKRDYSAPIPGLIDTYPYQEISQNKTIMVPVVAHKAGIVYLASKGCIEFHTWASKITDIHHPTWAVFDLDISVGENFNLILEAAALLNDYLNSIGIKAFAKTSGGSGMHVYVPIAVQYEFAEVKNWVKRIGEIMQAKYPDLFTLPKKQNKTHDSELVVIDYMQNIITRNTASVYTVRAKKGATVSTPVSWDEIQNKSFTPQDFTIKTVPGRIQKKGDLFHEVLELKQALPDLN